MKALQPEFDEDFPEYQNNIDPVMNGVNLRWNGSLLIFADISLCLVLLTGCVAVYQGKSKLLVLVILNAYIVNGYFNCVK